MINKVLNAPFNAYGKIKSWVVTGGSNAFPVDVFVVTQSGQIKKTDGRYKEITEKQEGSESTKAVYELRNGAETKPVELGSYYTMDGGDVVFMAELSRNVYLPLTYDFDEEELELAEEVADWVEWAKNSKINEKLNFKREENTTKKLALGFGAIILLMIVAGTVLWFSTKDAISLWQNNQEILKMCIQNGGQASGAMILGSLRNRGE